MGHTFMSLHYETFNPSSGYNHAACFHQFLLYLANSRDCGVDTSMEDFKSLTFMLLIELYGGPDHKLTFLDNQLSFIGLFLVGNMYKLNVTRGCPGISHLNTADIPMSLLN